MSKTDFANGARAFANRASTLPGYPLIKIISLGAAGILAISGTFGTGDLPSATRTAFWLSLMGWNSLKWQF